MHAYEIRGALPGDEDELFRVAHHLNTVNLPADRPAIRDLLELSQRSFSGQESDPFARTYVFVVIDRATDRIVGSSMIIAQLGRKNAPYIYVDVLDEERFSASLDLHIKHIKLQIGYSYDGPTELGGLIVDPEYRKKPEKLGLLISYVRFLFIKMHRANFRDELLAELLPPLEKGGGSHLWNAVGYHFMPMPYAEADRLSKTNKEFIFGLFPQGPIYATLLPEQAQNVIGKVGQQTKGVEKMLTRVGFRYAHRVDPFDGGPHFTCATDEVSLVDEARRAKVSRARGAGGESGKSGDGRAIVATDVKGAPYFRATLIDCNDDEGECVALGDDTIKFLDVQEGDLAWVVRLP